MIVLPHRRKAFRGGGTDWTADAALKALYYFETSPGLEQDSSGKGNHIDDAVSSGTPATDTTNHKQGSQAANYRTAGGDDGSILDYANATADFPCNGTGDGEVTIAGWFRPDTSTGAQYIFAMNNTGCRYLFQADNTLRALFEGTGQTDYTTTATLTDDTTYFIGIVYSDTDDELRFYIREDGAGSSTWETTSSTIGTLDDASAGDFSFGNRTDGGGFGVNGMLDAWAVFNGKAMSQAELDGVYDNGWDGNGW